MLCVAAILAACWCRGQHAGRMPATRSLAAPLAEFLNGDRPPIATAEEGRDVLKMTLACYDSAAQGRRVELG